MQKIVFIINTIPNQRCIKRITEFIENGYEIDAYSFIRKELSYKQPDNFTIKILDEFKNNGGYLSRIRIIINNIKSINRKYKNSSNVIFYYFGLDIALFASIIIRKKYFYEESDLPQTYISNKLLKRILDWMDNRIIKKSLESIFTSEGFIKYHFGYNTPKNITVIPNRVNKKCLQFDKLHNKLIDLHNLKIGFVGFIRYKSVLKFAEYFSTNFPNNEFHFFGTPIENQHKLDKLRNISNIFFHGVFQNPNVFPYTL